MTYGASRLRPLDELWICGTEFGPVLAPRDLTQPDRSIVCRKALPNEVVFIGRLAYKRIVRYLLEVLLP